MGIIHLVVTWLLFLPVVSLGEEAQSSLLPTHLKFNEYGEWIWETQLRPTIQNAKDRNNLKVLALGTVLTMGVSRYDNDIFDSNVENENRIMRKKVASSYSAIGAGFVGVGIAASQIYFDTPNGLKHARALILTSTTHVLLALISQRERPNGKEDFLPFNSSFPSGHAASAFATATSLAYAYGYKAGIPAYTVATAISLARLSENKHWLSDIVAGSTIGIFWAKSSYSEADNIVWHPVLFKEGGGLGVYADF